ncbi:MAG: DUF5916 domain-containing protein, partial [Woeseiaceae bacterium]
MPAAPIIDGIVDPDEWSAATATDTPFRQIQPLHNELASLPTKVRIGQTDTALYFAFEATDPEPDRIATALTQRDSRLREDDSIAMIIDTFGDGRTAYLFGANTIGTQVDGRIADNGRTRDLRWDAAWRTASARTPTGWTMEIEIPFAILRYASTDTADWGINLIRAIPRNLELSMWAEPSEDVFRVSSIGGLTAVTPPAPQDMWQFIPYALASIERGNGSDLEVGGDVRWRPSTRLGVDLTINPDFALVEADVEEINLSRFELQVPEKRPFFLEGNELYSQRIRQFYSRRIGDITWGAKTNGKLGNSDFSAIVTQEDFVRDDGLSSTIADYGVVRLQQSIGRGSNIGLLAANRTLDGENAGSVGVDTSIFFTDTLGMTAQYLGVHGPNSDGGAAWFVRPSWDTANSH